MQFVTDIAKTSKNKAQNKEKQPVTKHPYQYWPNSS
jgi:hypothetical protein